MAPPEAVPAITGAVMAFHRPYFRKARRLFHALYLWALRGCRPVPPLGERNGLGGRPAAPARSS